MVKLMLVELGEEVVGDDGLAEGDGLIQVFSLHEGVFDHVGHCVL